MCQCRFMAFFHYKTINIRSASLQHFLWEQMVSYIDPPPTIHFPELSHSITPRAVRIGWPILVGCGWAVGTKLFVCHTVSAQIKNCSAMLHRKARAP